VPKNQGELDAENPYLRLRLAFAPTGRLDDVGGRLFTKTYFEKLLDALDRRQPAPLYPYQSHRWYGYTTRQDSVIAQEQTTENRQRWTIQARWDGSVAMYLDVRPKREDTPCLYDVALFGDAIRPAAQALAPLVRDLGGYGRAHVALVVVANQFQIRSINDNIGLIPEPGSMLPIQAWTDGDGNLSDDTLDRMRRELCRAAGAVVWEPEPKGDPAADPEA
jgi:hypothetical protein